MPTTQRALSPSEGNDALGGIPEILYFDFQSRGRGQAVRLLLEDAQIAYDDTRYSFPEYPEWKETGLAKLNPVKTIPVVKLNGKILTQSYAILRHFARVLGKYGGQSEDEEYWIDAITDVVSDWRTLFLAAFLNPNQQETYPKHQEGDRKRFLEGIQSHLATHDSKSGSFILGQNFTYADIVLYQILHDENLTQEGGKGLQEYPRLKALVNATEERPNIKAFLASDRYRG
ncbi:uncharacterized protein KY384_000301 [Bacidia gigantensis]|uniref:uncharacterized protein n=1 Tax=Bacidia gigantensis TaxID=2732470 RepID=UPI001D047247|nr:uncharacterized protein KY384_000301 [Bacidia gigantensis]KAG8526308.1 hypothetical protein KY384_000301 [Bacidia gigantensis]